MSTNDLLSEENKKRCLEDFKNLMPLRSSKSTKSSAAVLIPIIPSNENVGLLYTKRSPHLRKHAREVCFPGGKVDEGETPTEAAVRESFEELGLHPEQIDVWATMPALSNHTGKMKYNYKNLNFVVEFSFLQTLKSELSLDVDYRFQE